MLAFYSDLGTKKKSLTPLIVGAGAGFLVAGPVGAVVGAVAANAVGPGATNQGDGSDNNTETASNHQGADVGVGHSSEYVPVGPIVKVSNTLSKEDQLIKIADTWAGAKAASYVSNLVTSGATIAVVAAAVAALMGPGLLAKLAGAPIDAQGMAMITNPIGTVLIADAQMFSDIAEHLFDSGQTLAMFQARILTSHKEIGTSGLTGSDPGFIVGHGGTNEFKGRGNDTGSDDSNPILSRGAGSRVDFGAYGYGPETEWLFALVIGAAAFLYFTRTKK